MSNSADVPVTPEIPITPEEMDQYPENWLEISIENQRIIEEELRKRQSEVPQKPLKVAKSTTPDGKPLYDQQAYSPTRRHCTYGV